MICRVNSGAWAAFQIHIFPLKKSTFFLLPLCLWAYFVFLYVRIFHPCNIGYHGICIEQILDSGIIIVDLSSTIALSKKLYFSKFVKNSSFCGIGLCFKYLYCVSKVTFLEFLNLVMSKRMLREM